MSKLLYDIIKIDHKGVIMKTIKENLNRYTISVLIFTITLFGGLSFIISKDTVDSLMNYYSVAIAGISIILLFFNNLEEFKPKNIKWLSFCLMIMTIIWLMITMIGGIRLNIESVKGLINFSSLLILGFIILNIKFSEEDKKTIFKSIYWSFFFCMILGIFQYFSGVNLIQYSNAVYPGILGRINSTFFIATILDKYIVLIAILLAYSMMKSPNSIVYKLLYLLGGIGISLTFSRGGQLVFLLITFLLFLASIFQKQLKNVLITIFTVVIMLFIPGTAYSLQSGLDFVYQKISLPNVLRLDITVFSDMTKGLFEHKGNNDSIEKDPNDTIGDIANQSVISREKYKAIGKQLIKEYPVFGIGVGNYSYLFNHQNFADYMKDTTALKDISTLMYPHSSYIQVTAEIGYIGLILLYVGVLSYLLYINRKKDILLCVTACLFVGAMLLAGYTEGVFHSKQYIFLFITILGFLCSKEKEEANSISEELAFKIVESDQNQDSEKKSEQEEIEDDENQMEISK